MEVVASWTRALCIDISQGRLPNHTDDVKAEASELGDKILSSWSVLDIGTGNGLLLQELAKQGYGFIFYPCIFCSIGREYKTNSSAYKSIIFLDLVLLQHYLLFSLNYTKLCPFPHLFIGIQKAY